MKRALSVVLVCLLSAACAKKAASPPAAVDPGAGKNLPPGATFYLELDAKAALASSVVAPYKDKLLETFPAECRAMAETTEQVAMAGYETGADALMIFPRKVREPVEGEAPPERKFAVVITGPTAAAITGCFEAIAAKAGLTITTETVAGKEVRVVGEHGELRLVSPSDTVHVLASLSMIEPTLAAVAGGPSLEGSPALESIPRVPAGVLVFGVAIPPEAGTEMMQGLAMLAAGKDLQPPKGMAASIELGDRLVIHGAVIMGDEASAQTLEEVGKAALGMAKAALGMAGGGDPSAGKIKAILEAVSITRSGAVIQVSVSVALQDLVEMLMERSSSRPVRAARPRLP
jgi:hypothetical protein